MLIKQSIQGPLSVLRLLIVMIYYYNYSHAGHPHFYNTLFGDADEIGLLGAFVSATSNTNVFTYEMAPVYTLMESQVFTQIRELVGWDVGDGIFSPGGSISNLYGLLLARFKQFPESRNAGNYGLPKMALFCSKQVRVGSG